MVAAVVASFVRAFLDAAIDDETTVTGAAAAAAATIYGSARSSRVRVAVPAVAVVVIAMVEALVFLLKVSAFDLVYMIDRYVVSSTLGFLFLDGFRGEFTVALRVAFVTFLFQSLLALFFLWYGSVFERSTKLCMLRK